MSKYKILREEEGISLRAINLNTIGVYKHNKIEGIDYLYTKYSIDYDEFFNTNDRDMKLTLDETKLMIRLIDNIVNIGI